MFYWKTHPAATALVTDGIESCLRQSAWLNKFSQRLTLETGTRLRDWIDRVSVDATAPDLVAAGFQDETESVALAMRHAAAQLPWVIPTDARSRACLAIRVDSILDFATSQRLDGATRVSGPPGANVRRLLIDEGTEFEVWAVERHGSWSWDCHEPLDVTTRLTWTDRFRLRPRSLKDESAELLDLIQSADQAVCESGSGPASELFFATERAFWQGRNTAGQVQKMRQDRMGLGWANHDHHTYRSSRWAFKSLIHVFETLGMICRERFYAGEQAGWGAQVMEHPLSGVVVFADVDLGPEEVVADFAHEPLAERDQLGTVGLWCALHGEAIQGAGLHHLECQFDFEAARQQLSEWGIASMKPFTDLPHLRQAFTAGERWWVDPARIDRALAANWINATQAEQFRREGAIGSHLEVLERHDGFKGFNPHGISKIIRDTDPRSLC